MVVYHDQYSPNSDGNPGTSCRILFARISGEKLSQHLFGHGIARSPPLFFDPRHDRLSPSVPHEYSYYDRGSPDDPRGDLEAQL